VGPPRVTYQALAAEIRALPVEDTLRWRPGQDYNRSTGAAMLLNIQAAEGPHPAATLDSAELTSRMLRVAAVLDPVGIDADLLAELTPTESLDARAQRVFRDAANRCISHDLFTVTDPESGPPVSLLRTRVNLPRSTDCPTAPSARLNHFDSRSAARPSLVRWIGSTELSSDSRARYTFRKASKRSVVTWDAR
jgi:hypothetical protein